MVFLIQRPRSWQFSQSVLAERRSWAASASVRSILATPWTPLRPRRAGRLMKTGDATKAGGQDGDRVHPVLVAEEGGREAGDGVADGP
jgi:hypothetical protein